jgi:hypothetical protein
MENLMSSAEETSVKEEAGPIEQEGVAWPWQPVPMPGLFDVVAQEVDGKTVLIIVVYTPSGAAFSWLSREDALEFASRVKKAATTGGSAETAAKPIKKQEAPKSKLIVEGSGH